MEHLGTLSKEELELHVSPSRWNPHRSPDDVIQQYVSFCIQETQRARERIPHKLNILYGTSPNQKYDLYGTDLSVAAPIVFWMHGGYWQEGNKDMSAVMAQNFYEMGFKTLVLGYSLAPAASVNQIQEEFFTALKHAMDAFEEAKFIVGGHSAGAQLASTLLHNKIAQFHNCELQSRLVGLILFSGVYDLRPLIETYVNEPLKLTREDAEELSPLLKPFSSEKLNEDLRILVCAAEMDPPAFQQQSQEYTEKLQRKFGNVDSCLSEQDDHFTLVENLSLKSSFSASVTLNFLKSFL